MRNSFPLARKDMVSYFNSWMGVFVLTFFFLIAGLFFYFLIVSYATLSMNITQNPNQNVQGLGLTRFVCGSFFLNLGAMLIFFVPLFSMRAFAEERKSQTLELLFTYPFSDFEIVWGKFLGMVWFFEWLALPTILYLFLIGWLGGNLDWGPVLLGYLGFWLLGTAYLALGLFVSVISENQVVSAIVTFSCLVLFWIVDWLSGLVDGKLARFLTFLSPLTHYREFALGVLDINNVLYFCFFQFYFLFLALRAVETRNWKG